MAARGRRHVVSGPDGVKAVVRILDRAEKLLKALDVDVKAIQAEMVVVNNTLADMSQTQNKILQELESQRRASSEAPLVANTDYLLVWWTQLFGTLDIHRGVHSDDFFKQVIEWFQDST